MDEERASHLSGEVEKWLSDLKGKERTRARTALERLRTEGPQVRQPHGRSLGGGLFELRFGLRDVQMRVTYHRHGHEFRTLTVFRKQKMNEKGEVDRARLNEQSLDGTARKAEGLRHGRSSGRQDRDRRTKARSKGRER